LVQKTEKKMVLFV